MVVYIVWQIVYIFSKNDTRSLSTHFDLTYILKTFKLVGTSTKDKNNCLFLTTLENSWKTLIFGQLKANQITTEIKIVTLTH